MKSEPESGALPAPEREAELQPDPATRGHVSRTGGRVLLALTDADYPTAALEQATLLAHSLEGPLHVLRVLLESQPFAPSWPDLDVVEATRRIQRCLAATRRTKSWCDRTLWEPLSANQLRIRVGQFVEQVTQRADELDAELIVLSPSMERLGETATALACASSRPVLVTRTFAPLTPMLAASDLLDDDFWVLEMAVELGLQLGAPVTAVHNVGGHDVGGHDVGGHDVGERPAPLEPASLNRPRAPLRAAAFESGRSRLAMAAERLRQPLAAVLANEVDPVDAILEQAQVHQATIVVGTRSSHWLQGLNERSIAARVVDRSKRSVVVTPRISPKCAAEEAPARA